jgi:hypothetical protein
MRSVGDLIDCQESRRESSNFHMGNEMGSLEDLIDFHEIRIEIPYCQVSKGEEMRQYENLLNLEVSSGQQGVLTGEDQRRIILIIGGIQIFLPKIQVEARACVSGATT